MLMNKSNEAKQLLSIENTSGAYARITEYRDAEQEKYYLCSSSYLIHDKHWTIFQHTNALPGKIQYTARSPNK